MLLRVPLTRLEPSGTRKILKRATSPLLSIPDDKPRESGLFTPTFRAPLTNR